MQLKIERNKLAAIVKPIAAVVDEAKLAFDDDGLSVRVVDPAHVCMLLITAPKAAFSSYTVLGKEPIGLDLDKITEALHVTTGETPISLETNDGMLIAKIGGTTRKMKLAPTESMTDPKLPSIRVPEKADVPLDEFQTALKAASPISDCIHIRTDPPDLVFEARGDVDSIEHRLPAVGTKEKVESLFPIDYLHNFLTALPSEATLTVHLGQDYPMYIDFSWGEGAQAITGQFMLAPRIESSS